MFYSVSLTGPKREVPNSSSGYSDEPRGIEVDNQLAHGDKAKENTPSSHRLFPLVPIIWIPLRKPSFSHEVYLHASSFKFEEA